MFKSLVMLKQACAALGDHIDHIHQTLWHGSGLQSAWKGAWIPAVMILVCGRESAELFLGCLVPMDHKQECCSQFFF